MGGRFCMSDDSHGVEQVGFGYRQVLEFMGRVGITVLHYLTLDVSGEGPIPDSRFPSTRIRSVTVEEVKRASYWA